MVRCRRWKVADLDIGRISEIVRKCDISKPIATILSGRNLEVSEIAQFLKPRLKDLSDPFIFPGMKTACERLWAAVSCNERILIFGDYDTDGVTSTALLNWVLTKNGARVDCFLPNRLDDGYGLTPETVEKSVDGHKLIVTVDCGISSYQATETAKEKGVDVIITDHHTPGERVPDAIAVINPKLYPEMAASQNLAGVGVAFKLCHAFVKYGRENGLGGIATDLREGLDLVALGTVADIVPLLGENRCMVKHGMKSLAAQERPGIHALSDIAGIRGVLRTGDISFRLAPRLNAAGRMDNAVEALNLLQADSLNEAYVTAKKLDALNRQRQTCEEQILKAAKDQVSEVALKARYSIVVSGAGWHLGVLGIVAAKLAAEYGRPTIVLSVTDDNEAKGSGRSVPGVDLVRALTACNTLLDKFGGHPMAAGLKLPSDNINPFIAEFEASVQEICADIGDLEPPLNIDGDMQLGELDNSFFGELELIQPFGCGNPAPVFRLSNIHGTRIAEAGEKHTRGLLNDDRGNSLPFIAFGRTPTELPEPPWEIAGIPEINDFNGRRTQQIQVKDLRHM